LTKTKSKRAHRSLSTQPLLDTDEEHATARPYCQACRDWEDMENEGEALESASESASPKVGDRSGGSWCMSM